MLVSKGQSVDKSQVTFHTMLFSVSTVQEFHPRLSLTSEASGYGMFCAGSTFDSMLIWLPFKYSGIKWYNIDK